MVNQVKQNLKRIRCYHSINHLESSIQKANENELSYLEFLHQFLQLECQHRDQTKIERNLKKSGFPMIKTFDDFDFSYQQTITKRRIKEWLSFAWLEQRENKILMGPPGVGKTHLAVSLGYEAIQKGYKVKFFSMNDLIDEMLFATQQNIFKELLKKYLKFDLLIVDEIGYLPIKQDHANLFFHLINEWYEFRSIVITSNKLFQEWGSAFGDQVITTAIVDRLLHHAEAILIEGDSYRMKGKIKNKTNCTSLKFQNGSI